MRFLRHRTGQPQLCRRPKRLPRFCQLRFPGHRAAPGHRRPLFSGTSRLPSPDLIRRHPHHDRTGTHSLLPRFARPHPHRAALIHGNQDDSFRSNSRIAPIIIDITDPVAQTKYTLDTINKVVHRQHLPVATVRKTQLTDQTRSYMGTVSAPDDPSAAVAIHPEQTTEKLGAQTIEGVLAEGTRSTTTYPIDSQGNDRPISVVRETWFSAQLNTIVLSKHNDPRNGEHTTRLINVSLAEPALSLFQPPPDYSIVDEPGAFTITWPPL